MRPRALPATTLDRTLAALADPTRRRLLDHVSRRPRRPTDLGRGLPMTRPAVSKHLRVLREAGLVEAVPQGRELLYRLSKRPTPLLEVRRYVDRLSQMWDLALERFKAFAEQEDNE
jgi:DNA-binding transcriptional ArsR family regulator